MWDDPLFNPVAEAAKKYLEDPDFIEARRAIRLAALELLYIRIHALERERDSLKEEGAQVGWVCGQLLERLSKYGVPAEIGKQVLIDARVVKYIEPGFSFAEMLGIG